MVRLVFVSGKGVVRLVFIAVKERRGSFAFEILGKMEKIWQYRFECLTKVVGCVIIIMYKYIRTRRLRARRAFMRLGNSGWGDLPIPGFWIIREKRNVF